MNEERVKLIIKNMQLLLDSLKKEFDSDHQEENSNSSLPYEEDYDEIFYDEDI